MSSAKIEDVFIELTESRDSLGLRDYDSSTVLSKKIPKHDERPIFKQTSAE